MKKRIFHLNLKRRWFDMILSGEKKEEYREVKPYWIKRLIYPDFHQEIMDVESLKDVLYGCSERGDAEETIFRQDINTIIFKNGYSKNAREMQVKCESICLGKTFPKWSGQVYADAFVISLGKILSTKNIKK